MIALHGAGRYAGYVAAAYGLSALVLLVLLASSLWSAHRWRRRAQGKSAPPAPGARR